MKNKYISKQSSELLTSFNDLGKDWFDISDAKQVLKNSGESAIKELLSDMVKRGLLMRLKKGLYHNIPYEKDPETFMPDWHLLAEPLSDGEEYYIGYYSALQIHGLITQPSLKEQVVVSKQIRPSIINIKNVKFQFIYHNKNHFFGSKKIWIDNFNKVNCSDLEKTLIDCLFRPDYAGGIVEIARALYESKDKINSRILLEYVDRFQSQAVIKRLGFLLEVLEIKSDIIEILNSKKTNSYILLDPEISKSGKMLSRWSIQQNVESETIKSSIYT